MSNSERLQQELQALREETLALRQRLTLVETKLLRLSREAEQAPVAASEVPPAVPAAQSTLVPPALPAFPPVLAPPPLPPPVVVPRDTTLPPVVPVAAVAAPPPLPELAMAASTPTQAPPAFPESSLPPAPLPTPVPEAPKESFELRLFVYWGVRLGIGLLLLAVVYFAIFLYQTITPQLGPASKMALLYLASGGIIAAGEWLRRRAGEEPRMKTFAAVVEGGGFGALYFTTLAGHVFEPLRIFQSPSLALGLLFGLGAFVLWWSERREAPALATGALLGAGVSAAIMPGSWVALGGTALFAALAVGQWWRLGWIGPSVASIVASYGAYGWWRAQAWRGLADERTFATEALLLALYWLIFTAGVFAPRPGRSALRTAFLTANNTAAYCLLARIIVDAHFEWFWRFTLLAGVALLGLAALAHRRLGTAEANAYRVQGLILVTLAIVSYFSGWQLGVMLCLESLALAAAASWRDSRLLLVAGLLAAALGAFAQFDYGALSTRAALIGGAASVGLMLGAAWISLRRPLAESQLHPTWFAGAAEVWSVLGAGLGLVLLGREASTHEPAWLAVALAIWGIMLLAAHRLVPTRSLPVAAFLAHLVGFVLWTGLEIQRWNGGTVAVAAWLPVVFVFLSLGHDLTRRLGGAARYLPTAAIVMASSAITLRHFVEWNAWCLAAPVLAAVWLLYGWRARDTSFAVGSLALAAGAVFIALARESDQVGPGIWPALLLALAPLALRELARRLAAGATDTPATDFLACFKLAIPQTALQVVAWILVAVPDPWKPLAFASLALAFALFGRWRELSFAHPASAGATGLTLLFVLAGFAKPLHWSQAAALGLAFAATEISRSGGRLSEVLTNLLQILRGALIAFGFGWITLRLRSEANAALFTAVGWTVYALGLMGLGLWRRDRLVRLSALAIFALTLLRVLIYEAWGRAPIYRVASFAALGLVLLGLGWVYTKYQDKLRDWL